VPSKGVNRATVYAGNTLDKHIHLFGVVSGIGFGSVLRVWRERKEGIMFEPGNAEYSDMLYAARRADEVQHHAALFLLAIRA
jgi:hypothetical protein